MKPQAKLLHVIIILANAYLQYTCVNPDADPMHRKWVYCGAVDLSRVAF